MFERLLKRLLFFTIILFVTTGAFAIEEVRQPSKGNEDWRILKQAQDSFSSGNYGEAIALAEKAKDSRKQECSWKVYTLEYALKSNAVRKVGNSLYDVIAVLKKRGSNQAVAIIEKEIEKHGKDFFNNDVQNLKEFVSKDNVYPEADYLIGKIYRLEGENDLSIQFMKKAYDASSALDVPEQKYDILYDLADISHDSGKYDDYEAYLLEILKDDQYFMDKDIFMPALVRTIKTDTDKAVEKFFKLYRSTNYISIKACYLLTKYYDEKGESKKALDCAALGSLTSFTKILKYIDDRKVDYSYETIKDVLKTSGTYSEIVDWGSENGVWELLYLFAKESGSEGCIIFSRELYTSLSLAEPVEYWRVAAEQALIQPQQAQD